MRTYASQATNVVESVPMSAMSPCRSTLTEQDIANLVAYIRSLTEK